MSRYKTVADAINYITDLYLDPEVDSIDLQYAIDVVNMYIRDLPPGDDLEVAEARAKKVLAELEK